MKRLTGAGMPEPQAENPGRRAGTTDRRTPRHEADLERLKDQLTIRLGLMLAGPIAMGAKTGQDILTDTAGGAGPRPIPLLALATSTSHVQIMASAIFDTHGFVKRLTAAGMPEPQAEILADEQFRLLHEQIATKGDVVTLGSDVANDIMALRSEVAREIGALRSEMAAVERRIKDQLTIRLGLMLGGAIAIVAALVRLL